MRLPGFTVLALLLSWPVVGLTANLTVKVEGIDGSKGHVLVAVCTGDQFLGASCTSTGKVPAAPGAVTILLTNVVPGVYAVQAFHDENDNMDIDRSLLGFPREGIGFSNDAPMRYGPPRFSDAAITIGEADSATRLKMRYFDPERSASTR
jgi:uncharacterized protein (DUF2141 family)